MITTNVNREKYIGAPSYPKREEKWATVITKKTKKPLKEISVKQSTGHNFAKNTLFPSCRARTVSSQSTRNYRRYRRSAGVKSSASSIQLTIIENSLKTRISILSLFRPITIAMRNSSSRHSKRKHVYCEKPLCLTEDELDRIETVYHARPCECLAG